METYLLAGSRFRFVRLIATLLLIVVIVRKIVIVIIVVTSKGALFDALAEIAENP